MKICLQLFSSNRLWIAIAQKVHMPARKPAVAPHDALVFASARNMARLIAITSEKIAVKPNILPLLPCFICSSDKLLSIIHALPKSWREYQIPPTAKAESPATITASQLIREKFIV